MNERNPTGGLQIEPERYELSEGPAYRFEVDRRDFLKLLGGGIIVVLTMRDIFSAQESGQSGAGNGAPDDIGAWVHIGEDGIVSVYTGKTEVGQNIRTSLSQVIAEELPVPLHQIRMVMADTDLTPFDAGTFGSRTTPTMAPQLRRAAAAARELLIDAAATQWNMDRSMISIAAGRITNSRNRDSLNFGQVTKGQKLVQTLTNDIVTRSASEWTVAGQPAKKVNGREMVTGRHQYTTDIKRPNMVVGRVLRAPAYNTSMTSVDASRARAIAGVTVVHDRDFVGVTAPDERTANEAIQVLDVGWDRRPHLSESELFDHLRKEQGAPGRVQERGSIEAGMAEADHQLQQTYTVAYIAHTPLEPRAAVAEWTDDKLTVWTGTQRPFGVRSELAQAFGIPEDRVRVIVPDTGSGYGGKHTGEAAIEAARLAKAAGRPVKLVWTREEEFMWAYFRPAGVIDISSGVKNDGSITAWEFHNYNSGNSAISPMYSFPNQRVQFHAADSPMRQGSYKGLAATANHFARESHMDALAARVGMDPLEFRYRNLTDSRLRAVYEAAAERFQWGPAKSTADRGYGLAGGFDKGGYISTFAEVSIGRTGDIKVERVVAAFECGAIVNPDQLRNQVEGAVVMGIGGALFEGIQFEAGLILNGKMSKYRLPRFSDVPAIDVVLVDRKDLPSAGAGETPIVGIAPAIANAIAAATGQRLTGLPLAPYGITVG